jgi:hypothetical protein
MDSGIIFKGMGANGFVNLFKLKLMKKAAFIAGAALLMFTLAANAQTDTLPQTQPVKTNTDKWNNHDPAKYQLQAMPEALSREKIFPVIGKYNLTDKEGATSAVTIMIDESNKGLAWIDGLPQGRIKAHLRQSPGTYKIPAQKTADDKSIPEGVLVFDKDANTLDVCLGCTYNVEDPGAVFASTTTTEPVVTETETKTKKSGTVKTKTKTKPVKTWKYSGTKIVETTASSTVPMEQ